MPNRDVPLGFPLKGMDVTREFGQQPDGTSADAVNVASRDSIAGRDRGGSRTGFSKYIPVLGADGAVKIQMLDVIVDPSLEALTQNFVTPGDDWIPHPRYPDILIPPFGAPWQPNPNINSPDTKHIESVSGEGATPDLPSRKLSLSLSAAPLAGDMIIVCVFTQINDADGSDGNLAATVDVENAAAVNLTQIGSYVATDNATGTDDSYWRVSMWYKVAVGVNDQTIHIHPSPDTLPDEPTDVVYLQATVMQFRGMATIAPVIDDVSNTSVGSVTTLATGNLTTEDGCLVVACMSRRGTPVTTPTLTLRSTTIASIDAFCALTKRPISVPPDNPLSVVFTFSAISNVGLMAASFKKAP